MWQKLNRIDSYELEKARVQLINAIQLVSAVPCSYAKNDSPQALLKWNHESFCIESCDINTQNPVKISLDIQRLVLSIHGENDHIEHLVLSGITYPMAFGWMKIKLDSFDIDSDLFDDSTEYSLERALGPNEELNVTNQHVFNELAIYYANAYHLLSELKKNIAIKTDIYIQPENLSLILPIIHDKNEYKIKFTPGDKNFLEPYYSMEFPENGAENLENLIPPSGFWNNKDWRGIILLTGDFLTLEPEEEKSKVYDFLIFNYEKIIDSK